MATERGLESWLFIGGAIATTIFFGAVLFQPGAFVPGPDWEVSDGCLGGLEHENVGISEHYHPYLRISIDGEQIQIPPQTGIDQTGCREGMRWVHVHESSETGLTKLHIETPTKMNVPLGSFFEIWEREGGAGLTPQKQFDVDRNGISDWEEYDISLRVDGSQNEDFETYIMEDGDEIVLTFTSK